MRELEGRGLRSNQPLRDISSDVPDSQCPSAIEHFDEDAYVESSHMISEISPANVRDILYEQKAHQVNNMFLHVIAERVLTPVMMNAMFSV